MNRRRHLTGLVLAAITAVPLLAQNHPFVAGCSLPFTGEPHDIDDKCAREGDPDGGPNGKLQNQFKTNFCASDDPITVTDVTFKNLQAATDDLKSHGHLHFGSPTNEPHVDERSQLADLAITNPDGESVGEGKRVRMVAYLLHADFSGGETVNCNSRDHKILPGGQEYLDIHVYLSKTKPVKPVTKADNVRRDCRSMTAEIIPHQRPSALNKIAAFHDKKTGAKAFDLIAAAKLNRPMRFTGQMFFDGAHTPCAGDNDENAGPKRFSSWEIHPIYAMDVCKFTTKAKCRVDHDSDWKSFEEWMEAIESGENQ